jgi:hypothetical protein
MSAANIAPSDQRTRRLLRIALLRAVLLANYLRFPLATKDDFPNLETLFYF